MWKYLRIVCFFYFTEELLAAGRPPVITKGPNTFSYFTPFEAAVLECEADGEPRPRYKWISSNRLDVADNERITQLPFVGTLVINSSLALDQGIYQCFAYNKFGMTKTLKVLVRYAQLYDFPIQRSVIITPQPGTSLTLECVTESLSIPYAELSWISKNTDGTGNYTPIRYDKRVQMDPEGRLRFANILPSDGYEDKAYACDAYNRILKRTTRSRWHFIRPTQGVAIPAAAEVSWATPEDIVRLYGTSVVLKCIFSGNPTPNVYWERDDGTPFIYTDRIHTYAYSTELLIHNLQFEDAAVYVCWANNTSTTRVARTINLRVDSVPDWKEGYKPQSQELPTGGTATFLCNGTFEPRLGINWFINTVPLRKSNHPLLRSSRFHHPSAYNITIVDLIEEDTLAIQCNLTSYYGITILADAYLKVLGTKSHFGGRCVNSSSCVNDLQCKTYNTSTHEYVCGCPDNTHWNGSTCSAYWIGSTDNTPWSGPNSGTCVTQKTLSTEWLFAVLAVIVFPFCLHN